MRTENATRERLCAVLRTLPPGSKTALAQVCGFATLRRLKAVARYNAYLTPGVARRLETIMDAIERGTLVMINCGHQGPGPYPRIMWRWSAEAARTRSM